METNDHDLLIELRTEMRNLRNDIKELKDGTASRIECLEKGKADERVVEALQDRINNDIEVRLRKVEGKTVQIIAYACGVGAIVAIIIQFLSNFIK